MAEEDEEEDPNFVYLVRVAIFSSLDVVAAAEDAFRAAAEQTADEVAMGDTSHRTNDGDDVSELGSAKAPTIGRTGEAINDHDASGVHHADDDDDDDNDVLSAQSGGSGGGGYGMFGAQMPRGFRLSDAVERVTLSAELSLDVRLSRAIVVCGHTTRKGGVLAPVFHAFIRSNIYSFTFSLLLPSHWPNQAGRVDGGEQRVRRHA